MTSNEPYASNTRLSRRGEVLAALIDAVLRWGDPETSNPSRNLHIRHDIQTEEEVADEHSQRVNTDTYKGGVRMKKKKNRHAANVAANQKEMRDTQLPFEGSLSERRARVNPRKQNSLSEREVSHES